MCVKVAGNMSNLRKVTGGFLQGSVVGPVLFLIYVNCIATAVSCTFKAFTDDYKLYLSFQ